MWTVSVPNSLFGSFNPFAEEIDGDWIVYPEQDSPKKHLGDVYLNGAQLLRGRVRGRRSSDPPLRTEVLDDWTGHARPGPRPEQTRLRLVRRGRRRRDDDLGELPGRGPQRGAGRDQRAALRLLPDRAPPRLHHRARLRAGAGGLPVDAADRRPAGPDRPELGQGLDHRGQRHPRREVLGDLARQGGVDRPQLRDRARRQARLPVPARVGVLGPADRLGQGAHRLARRPAQHDLRLRPERHRRPPRLRLLDDRGQPHLQHRAQARVLRLRDRRHQAARRDRRGHPAQPHPRLLARHLAGLADAGHPHLAQRLLRATTGTCSSRSATAPTSSTTTSSRPRRRCELFSQGGAFVNNLVCGTLRLRAGDGPRHAVPRAAQHPGRRLRGDLRRRRPVRRQRLPRRGRRPRPTRRSSRFRDAARATARPCTTGHPTTFAEYLARIDEQPGGRPRALPRRASSPSTSATTSTPAAHARRTPSRTRSCSTARSPSRSSTRATRCTCRPSCRRTSTAPASGRHRASICSACASSTRTSRSATAARCVIDVDLRRRTEGARTELPGRPDRRPRRGTGRLRVW